MPNETKEAFVKDRSKAKKQERKYDRHMGNKDKYPNQDRGNKDKRQDPKFPRTNDASWYFKYPTIAETSSKFAFNHRNGAKVTLKATYALGVERQSVQNHDGFAICDYILTPGNATSGDDAINITSKSAWKMLNRRFRGNRPYQQSDFGIIQFAIVDFMSSLAEAERVYGLLQYYALNNKQVPDSLLLSLGYEPTSFSDLADYRLQLNKLVLKARTLCLVRGYSLLDHALLLASNVFKDKDSARAQLIAFRKAGRWVYDPTNPNGSALLLKDNKYSYTFAHYGSIIHFRTMQDVLDDLSEQINALLDDDDVDQICSDILAFYGNKEDPAELITIASVPEDYTVKAIYSDMILRQWHNAVFFVDANAYSSATPTLTSKLGTDAPTSFNASGAPMIYQENNVIKFNLHAVPTNPRTYVTGNYTGKMGTGNYTHILTPIVDTDILDPTPQDVMEMTRFTTALNVLYDTDSGGAALYRTEVVGMPSTLMLSCSIYLWQNSEYSISGTQLVFTTDPEWSTLDTNCGAIVNRILVFDWHPLSYVGFSTPSSTIIISIAGDVDNYITMDKGDLSPMHEAALLSEFKNPIIDMILKED